LTINTATLFEYYAHCEEPGEEAITKLALTPGYSFIFQISVVFNVVRY